MLTQRSTKDQVGAYARSLGFDRVAVTSADPLQKEGEFLQDWLKQGRAGEMDYLERQADRRSQPNSLLPGAKSIIALALNYYNAPVGTVPTDEYNAPLGTVPTDVKEGRISRYAAGRDYHKVIGKRLEALVRYIEALSPGCECRTFVDTGPLLERALAQRAGLGFIGKNTMLITKGLGSWVFLASVVTTLDLPQDAPDERSCGECRICIDACPTEAITAPFELDARRCISYLTIESDKPIPEPLRPNMGGWIFGCDICQEVCPHNALKKGSAGEEPTVGLSDILAIQSEEEFRNRFAGTSITRAGRSSLIRNACVAAANLGRRDLIPQLEKLSRQDPDSVVGEQAAWALEQLR